MELPLVDAPALLFLLLLLLLSVVRGEPVSADSVEWNLVSRRRHATGRTPGEKDSFLWRDSSATRQKYRSCDGVG